MSLIPPRVACLSQKGGGGKTTLATNLAVAAARAGVRTLLLDLDAQQSSARAWGTWRASRRPKPGLPLTITPVAWDDLEAALKGAAKAKHQLIILDTPGQKGAVSNYAASVSNIVLVTVQPSMLDLATITETLALNNVANRPAFVFFNRVPDRAALKEATDVVSGRGIRVAPVALSNLRAYQDAAGEGLGVLELELEPGATKAASAELAKARGEVEAALAWVRERLADYPKAKGQHVDQWGRP
jgi:chromosome partitioning protein